MHQYLFYIGDFPIRMYGLVLCMSIFLATGVAYFLAKQDGRWHQHVLDIGIYGPAYPCRHIFTHALYQLGADTCYGGDSAADTFTG